MSNIPAFSIGHFVHCQFTKLDPGEPKLVVITAERINAAGQTEYLVEMIDHPGFFGVAQHVDGNEVFTCVESADAAQYSMNRELAKNALDFFGVENAGSRAIRLNLPVTFNIKTGWVSAATGYISKEK